MSCSSLIILSFLNPLIKLVFLLSLKIINIYNNTFSYSRLIPESTRWLVLHRKHGKAEKVLAKAARFNKVVLPSDPLKLRTLPNGTDKTGCNEFLLEDVDERSTERKTSHLCSGCNLLDMFRLNELRRCSLIQFYIWYVLECLATYE